MSRTRLTNDMMIERAKSVVTVLRQYGKWVDTNTICSETGLTIGQLKAAIKFERRYFLKCPERCGNTYILSGKHGYKLPESNEDYIAMYKSLFSWGKSVLITISPMGKWLQAQGYDMRLIREEAMLGNTGDVSEIGGSDSWHGDND